jgi:hypothetical protein
MEMNTKMNVAILGGYENTRSNIVRNLLRLAEVNISLLGRDREKVSKTAEALTTESGKKVSGVFVDGSDKASLKKIL